MVHVDATQSGVTFKKASLISAHHQPSHHQQSSDVNELEQTIATLNGKFAVFIISSFFPCINVLGRFIQVYFCSDKPKRETLSSRGAFRKPWFF